MLDQKVTLERAVTEHKIKGNLPHLAIITAHHLLVEMVHQTKEDPMVHQMGGGIHPHRMEIDPHHHQDLKISHLMATDKEVPHRQETGKTAPLHPNVTAYPLHGPETDHQIEDQMGQTQIQTFPLNVSRTHHLNVSLMHHLSVNLMHHLNACQMHHLNVCQMHHLSVNLIILPHNANLIILPLNRIRDQIFPHLKITLHNNKDNRTSHHHSPTLNPIYRQTRRQQTPVILALKFHQ